MCHVWSMIEPGVCGEYSYHAPNALPFETKKYETHEVLRKVPLLNFNLKMRTGLVVMRQPHEPSGRGFPKSGCTRKSPHGRGCSSRDEYVVTPLSGAIEVLRKE